MIYKDNPKFSIEFVENALRQHYQEKSSDRQSRSSLRIFCQECSAQDENMLRIFFRLVKQDTNNILIDSVINSLPKDTQKYVRLKYKSSDYNVTAQEQQTHVTRGQLNIWRIKILEKIWHAFNYELTFEDIYFPKKIVNMLEVLATLLSVYNNFDPNHRIVDQYYVQCLEHYYNSYRKLLDALNECIINQDDDAKINMVVAEAVRNPYMTKEALAANCGLNQGTYSRYLKLFEKKVTPYVVKT